MHYLVTGHTGFKGSWLSAMLGELGHKVSGLSLSPEFDSMFNLANISKYLSNNLIEDIRFANIGKVIRELKPDVVIHLAAQSLVIESYNFPIKTFETNLIGTLRLLDAIKECDFVQAILIVTSDKVYLNNGKDNYFKETDPLGGLDPYSASKSCQDLATISWASSFNDGRIGIARAGNVIGGGDTSRHRIIPDIVKSIRNETNLVVRNPNATRPWQHVLDCLNGYLKLTNYQLQEQRFGIWNFGPSDEISYTVNELISKFGEKWGHEILYQNVKMEFKEAQTLLLDVTKSAKLLGVKDKLDFDASIEWTVNWFKHENPEEITKLQINEYLNL